MTSKYDYVKIKVFLDVQNYFILSRFQLSRMLTFCQIPNSDAVRLSLEVKKLLVDGNQTKITESELRECVFQAVTRAKHGGARFERLYQTLFQFHSARIPLLIFLSGTGCTGKTSVSHVVVSKLNNCHSINTDLVMETIASIAEIDGCCESNNNHNHNPHETEDAAGNGVSSWLRGCSLGEFREACRRVALRFERLRNSSEGERERDHHFLLQQAARDEAYLSDLMARNRQVVVREWEHRSQLVAQSIQGEVRKALREGKTLVVEGSLVDLSLYANLCEPSGTAAAAGSATPQAVGSGTSSLADVDSNFPFKRDADPIVMFAVLTQAEEEEEEGRPAAPDVQTAGAHQARSSAHSTKQDASMMQSWMQLHRDELFLGPNGSLDDKKVATVVSTLLLQDAFGAVHLRHMEKLEGMKVVKILPSTPSSSDDASAAKVAVTADSDCFAAPKGTSFHTAENQSVLQIPFSCRISNGAVHAFFDCVLNRIQHSLLSIPTDSP